MLNYAEELAYWYLRLNGFFLLSNYVYHRLPHHNREGSYNADADILAIRPPFFYEEIGGERLGCDEWIENLNGRWVGVIAEVKGSHDVTLDQIERAFSFERLEVAVQRIGLIQNEILGDAEVLPTLEYQRGFEIDNILLIKILFSANDQYRIRHDPRWHFISLVEAEAFIHQRIQAFIDPKFGGRYFFPSSLFQYIIWKQRPELV